MRLEESLSEREEERARHSARLRELARRWAREARARCAGARRLRLAQGKLGSAVASVRHLSGRTRLWLHRHCHRRRYRRPANPRLREAHLSRLEALQSERGAAEQAAAERAAAAGARAAAEATDLRERTAAAEACAAESEARVRESDARAEELLGAAAQLEQRAAALAARLEDSKERRRAAQRAAELQEGAQTGGGAD